MNFLELVPVPPRDTFNLGLNPLGNKHMLELFGHPVEAGEYRADGECATDLAEAFQSRLVTRNVGPFRATGIRPAIESLQQIFERVRQEVPALFELLESAGMTCARYTRIRKNGQIQIGPGISNHSWGTAIDIALHGALDRQGDGLTQRGLLVLSAYFNAAGWYWGAAFPTEDAMHFEVSRSLMARWRQARTV